MKTDIANLLAVSLVLAIGLVRSSSVSTHEQPIWNNFMNEATLTGNAPVEKVASDTVPIWQAQLDVIQESKEASQADRKASADSLAVISPIWSEQCKCL